MSTPIYFQSLSDTVRQLKSGALSSEKLTETMLTRVHALDGGLHAYARTLDESALLTARSLDAARRAGQPLGALHGVPVAIKDLLFTRGIATASGTAVMADFRPDFDATVVTKLKAAGAVIIGKTQLTEGAYGNHHPDIAAPVILGVPMPGQACPHPVLVLLSQQGWLLRHWVPILAVASDFHPPAVVWWVSSPPMVGSACTGHFHLRAVSITLVP